MSRLFLFSGGFFAITLALFFLLAPAKVVQVFPGGDEGIPLHVPEAESASANKNGGSEEQKPAKPGDIENQPQLQNPPETVKAIYLTSWAAGSVSKLKHAFDLIKETELNGVVVDIKDYSGFVAYRTGVPEISAGGAENDIRIVYPNKLIKRFHDENIYVIGRISVFQDPILAKAHPEWALRDKMTSSTWYDRKGLAWMDPSAQEVWDYNIAIAKDALSRGFDEINFDYIRFASDGDLDNIIFPRWDKKSPRSAVMKKFFSYLRNALPDAKISADLFGLSTVDAGDLGIGQVIENAYRYFDFVSPMVYPSHYAAGSFGYQDPAARPYEIVKYSMDGALARLQKLLAPPAASSTASSSAQAPAPLDLNVKLRPWLQDFDLGANYDAEMVRAQIRAVSDSLEHGSTTGRFGGWLLWDPSNVYTEGALEKDANQ